jgi:hypothetical protein
MLKTLSSIPSKKKKRKMGEFALSNEELLV